MGFRRGHLLYFVTVAEEGQITRAARKLHLAQPALSQAIAQLESDLGLILLERHARGVSLTPAGEVFFEKARAAVHAWTDALATAQSLARARQSALDFGFLGAPPGLDSPDALAAFAAIHPNIDVRYRELPFPTAPTSAWLADVDLAVSHLPAADEDVWTQVLRREGRVALVPTRHRLAAREELTLADVLDETFVGLHPLVEPVWAGFWSLDDHRGGPPRTITSDQAGKPQEVFAALAVRDAITTVPASVARVLLSFPTGVVPIPVTDAGPVEVVFAGRHDRRGPIVEALLAFAREGVRGGRGAGPPPDHPSVVA
jgi:DNA-binding transcriptional LysR family regulator